MRQALLPLREAFPDSFLARQREIDGDLTAGRQAMPLATFQQRSSDDVTAVSGVALVALRQLVARAEARAEEAGVTLAVNVMLLLLALVVTLGGLFLVLRRVIAPIGAMTGAMRRLSVGELEVEIPGLGRQDEIGSLEVGKLADVALWRLDSLGHIDIADPVAALVLGGPPPLKLLLVNGEPVVEDDQLVGVDVELLAQDVHIASQTLLSRV